jgi:hypothetical protein
MATIATTTQSNPFEYPGQSLLTRHPSKSINNYMCLVAASTASNYVFYNSQDKGNTWSALATVVRSSVVDLGAIFQDGWGWCFWAYRTNESSQDRIYLRRISTVDGSSTFSEVLLGSPGNGGSAGSVYSGLDVKTVYLTSTGYHYVAVAVGTNSGSNQGVTILGALIDPSGNCTSAPAIVAGTNQWLHAGTAGRVGPSMDLEHNGDGYTSSTPNLWVAYGRTHLKLVKISWAGHGWDGSPGETTIYSGVGNLSQMCGRWDGSRFMMCAPDPVNTSQVMVFERNRANSSTTTYRSNNHTTGVVRSAILSYDPSTGNVRVWAVGTSTAVLYQADWTRSGATWSAWASTGLAAILGTNADNYGAKRSASGDARWGLYTAASGSPNTLTYTPISLSYSPNTPTWSSPNSGAAADVALPLPLAWNFSDNDPGDTQSAYAISRQIGAGALSFWRASDGTWQVAEVQNSSSSTAVTLPAGWAAATDAVYTYKVKVWDSGSNASGYSAGVMVVPSTPVNPTLTAPTPSQVLGTGTVTPAWTAAEQTQYRITLDKGGVLATFTATTSSSWPNTDSGQSVTNAGGVAADFSANGSVGQHSNGSVNVLRSSTLDLGNANQDITVDVAVNKASATGASITQWVCARYSDANNHYIARLDLTTAGAVTLTVFSRVAGTLSGALAGPLTLATGHASNDNWRVRIQVLGSTISAKAWPATASEPPLWYHVVTDANLSSGTQMSLMTRLETGNTDTTPITSWDNLKAVPGAAVDYDSGWIGDTSARSTTPPVVLNTGDAWVLTLRTKNVEGLESVEQRVYFTASFTPPMTPTVTLTPQPASGVIQAVVTNPTPTGGAPAVATQDLYRRVAGDGTNGIRVATGLPNAATYNDWKAVSGVNYEYRVLTIGTTGVSVYGAWTS